jgi:hypothetical protein
MSIHFGSTLPPPDIIYDKRRENHAGVWNSHAKNEASACLGGNYHHICESKYCREQELLNDRFPTFPVARCKTRGISAEQDRNAARLYSSHCDPERRAGVAGKQNDGIEASATDHLPNPKI